jgi:hypothetical protein
MDHFFKPQHLTYKSFRVAKALKNPYNTINSNGDTLVGGKFLYSNGHSRELRNHAPPAIAPLEIRARVHEAASDLEKLHLTPANIALSEKVLSLFLHSVIKLRCFLQTFAIAMNTVT